ncbi:RING-type E3 ubiquitin-protein ligase PPIL2-like isoform X1 [Patiria miniata]|uniref:RING-type E3 ubiquitin-protein ligase PPIL2 n=2 Tax=Patiria miniata TaxID=46514 RepID=A0A914A5Q7_PATMI|nr:RING-type E3 ubiquitin-protein ligase PPIL2-like isoform X1 [Patiria miniata]
MGKRQHQSDKMYITSKEYTAFFGGKKLETGEKAAFRRLPFDHCSLSFQPFEHPYCTKDGVMFDLISIMPYIKKYKTNPITGEAMDTKALIKLNFHKNANGKYHCPVTYRIFNANTHIVAVKPTGNVFSYEAVDQLNIKAKNWKDLLTDEPFTRKDLITLQDPSNLDKFNITAFYHVQNNLKVETESEKQAREGAKYFMKSTNAETKDILEELYRDYKPAEKKEDEKKSADHLNAAHYSTGMVAAGFTSTAMTPQTSHEAAIIDEDIIRYERVKKKGYVRLVTSQGMLNLELHCDLVKKTCENFLKLVAKGYYKGTIFHRSIKNFMIQGGDPTGTGKGGESAWVQPFKDEFKSTLSHTGRGVLSMANSGPNTNKSQFFITYRSCKHLDKKHTIFGRVVGGMDTLANMERIETDKKDRPKETITLEDVIIFVNPFDEVDEELANERRKKQEELESKKDGRPKTVGVLPTSEERPATYRKGVGKYIPSTVTSPPEEKSTTKRSAETAVTSDTSSSKKKSKSSSKLTDFSAW